MPVYAIGKAKKLLTIVEAMLPDRIILMYNPQYCITMFARDICGHR